jgi:hypothetical protein
MFDLGKGRDRLGVRQALVVGGIALVALGAEAAILIEAIARPLAAAVGGASRAAARDALPELGEEIVVVAPRRTRMVQARTGAPWASPEPAELAPAALYCPAPRR